MFPHEFPHDMLRLFGPSLVTTCDRIKSQPHDGKEQLLRL